MDGLDQRAASAKAKQKQGDERIMDLTELIRSVEGDDVVSGGGPATQPTDIGVADDMPATATTTATAVAEKNTGNEEEEVVEDSTKDTVAGDDGDDSDADSIPDAELAIMLGALQDNLKQLEQDLIDVLPTHTNANMDTILQEKVRESLATAAPVASPARVVRIAKPSKPKSKPSTRTDALDTDCEIVEYVDM